MASSQAMNFRALLAERVLRPMRVTSGCRYGPSQMIKPGRRSCRSELLLQRTAPVVQEIFRERVFLAKRIQRLRGISRR